MDNIIPVFYSEYGRYISRSRMIPSNIDGLIPVNRRLLLVMHKIAKKTTKSARIVGETIGTLHAHGDCLRGSTLIPLLDGSLVPISELCGKEPQWVLTYDKEKQDYIPTKAHSWRVGQITKELYKIHLSNGGIIECTANHPFLLNTQKWSRADKLNCGDFLFGGSIYKEDSKKLNIQNPEDILKRVSADCSIHIIKIEKIILDKPEEFYDFTVDNYHNMIIATTDDPNNINFVVAHNSSAYGSLVNLVYDGYADSSKSTWGGPGLVDVPAPAARYCVVGDTLITTNYGNIPIKNFFKDVYDEEKINNRIPFKKMQYNLKVLCHDNQYHDVSHMIYSGYHDIVEIKTKNGIMLRCTPNHPLLVATPNGFIWKEAQYLTPNDWLCQPNTDTIIDDQNHLNDCNIKYINEEEATLLGLILSDGYIRKYTIGFSNTDMQLNNLFELYASKYISDKIIKYNKLTNKELVEFNINSVDKVNQFVEEYDIPVDISKNRRVPHYIYYQTQAVIGRFLQALYDGEGSVTKTGCINFSNSSIRLCAEIQLLLKCYFSITSTITLDKHINRNPCYKIMISDLNSRLMFAKYIGFNNQDKKERLFKFINNLSNYFGKHSGTKIDLIPFAKKRVFGKGVHCSRLYFRRNFSDYDNDNQSKYKHFYDSNYIYSQVISVTPVGKDHVYDLTVPEIHSFTANGYYVHNTETSILPWVEKLAFEFIDFVPWELLELSEEPLYLPSPIPIGLVGDGIISGISYHKTVIPRYDKKDLVKRLLWLIQNGKPQKPVDISEELDPKIYGPCIKPKKEDCDVDEFSKNDFYKLLIFGEGKVIYKPKANIITEKKQTFLEILGKAPLSTFQPMLNAYSKNLLPFTEKPIDQSKKTNIRILAPLKKNISNTFLSEFKENYLNKPISFKCYFCDLDGKVNQYGIDDILLNSFNHWYQALLKKLLNDIYNINYKLFLNTISFMIKNILHNNKKIMSVDDIIKNFDFNQKIKQYDYQNKKWIILNKEITETDVRETCKNVSIQKLIEYHSIEENLKEQFQLIKNNIDNINNYILIKIKDVI